MKLKVTIKDIRVADADELVRVKKNIEYELSRRGLDGI